jgi:hypothetical protein
MSSIEEETTVIRIGVIGYGVCPTPYGTERAR